MWDSSLTLQLDHYIPPCSATSCPSQAVSALTPWLVQGKQCNVNVTTRTARLHQETWRKPLISIDTNFGRTTPQMPSILVGEPLAIYTPYFQCGIHCIPCNWILMLFYHVLVSNTSSNYQCIFSDDLSGHSFPLKRLRVFACRQFVRFSAIQAIPIIQSLSKHLCHSFASLLAL